ncbi:MULTISPECIES: hypothetical protein [Sinorhizobium]|uniref:hypothetical protein n=1 Tax=Sinorhizobium TaxID=28105 RepID=UPI000381722E|nr:MULTISPECIES: hypothetical protein [Sinorhizobium]PND22368.1 hypothetical protein CN934_05470 [Ensifer sp. MMN_5]PND27004.1 hypothetical protein CN933_14930 [Sinorhizobium sp. M4_45]RVQ04207.1 hypothetical protein CN070_03260 [Sinorhizobium meliloti]
MWAIAASAQASCARWTGDAGFEIRIANQMNHAEGKQFLMISLPRFAKSATVSLVNDGHRVYFACFRETLPGSGPVLI